MSCSSCQRLRITCDAGLPSCLSCTVLGHPDCSYSVQIGWINSSSTNELDQIVEIPRIRETLVPKRSLPSLPDSTPFELLSLDHFLSGVAPTLVAIECPSADNPNFSYLSRAVSHHPTASRSLYHALVASGAAHALNWGVTIDRKLIVKNERMALRLLERDLGLLAERIGSEDAGEVELRERVNSILAVMQVLILYCTTVGDTKMWRRHLQGAAGLIEQVVRLRQGKRPLYLDRFIVETLRYSDVQTALSENKSTIIPPEVPVMDWEPSQTVVSSSGTLMHGFSADYRTTIGKICGLADRLAVHRTLFSPSNPTFSLPLQPLPQRPSISPASSSSSTSSPPHSTAPPPPPQPLPPELGALVAEITYDLERTRQHLANLEADPEFRRALVARLPFDNHSARLEGYFSFAESVFFASKVYLARTLSEEQQLGEEAMGWVYEGLSVLEKVPCQGSAANLLAWALVVIGSELSDDEPARSIVRLRLKALEALGHMNFIQTTQLMEEVWKKKDRNKKKGGRAVTWQEVMKNLGWDLLIV